MVKKNYNEAEPKDAEIVDVQKDGFEDTVPVERQVQRKLKQRHLQMIAIGGTIGTGIFVSSGASIAAAGPGGALVSYLLVAVMVYFIVMSLGEMSALIPVSGAFTTFASRFVDPALGFTLGWIYWAQWAISIPSELTAAGFIIQFWNPDFPIWASSLIIIVVLFCVNLIGVRIYGETEYWLSLVKVLTVIAFIIVGRTFDNSSTKTGILVDAGAVGGQAIGASSWQLPGAAFNQGALGIFQVLLFAFFSFGGT
ncbi:lysine-specific permease, partial [Jimgerdemannia flammicorona]